ncbi:hypothetical protein SJI19_16560 [Acerihabitans sp. TG2]|uniref:hypothetical protein n=1 Tax=Acerihabitans sp. TG2 TaxID=3096008 RepID=UPI002B23D6D4|nr:hypothetical protein [Acerihabitans sp. TG2]MEA9392137.1 hypothetical protein [Acerihabitans sp. TG2]
MFSVNRKVKDFKCNFMIAEIKSKLYLIFKTDSEYDLNYNSGVTIIPFTEGFYSAERDHIKLFVRKNDQPSIAEGKFIYDIVFDLGKNGQKIIHSIHMEDTLQFPFSKIKKTIESQFYNSLTEFLGVNSGVKKIIELDVKQKTVLESTSATNYLSNTKFITGVISAIVFGFLVIHFSTEKSDVQSEPTASYDLSTKSQPFHEALNPAAPDQQPVKTKSINNVHDVDTTKGKNLSDFLQNTPTLSDVNKVLNTPFQDADASKQQVELTSQVLDRLKLPRGPQTDTGCFSE